MKLKTTGQALIIILAVAMAAVADVARFKPAALTLVDKETKEPLFRISADKTKPGSISAAGANFPTTDSDGFPQCTLMLPANVCPDQRVEYIKNTYGFALDAIAQLEVQVQSTYDEVSNTLGKVVADMEVD